MPPAEARFCRERSFGSRSPSGEWRFLLRAGSVANPFSAWQKKKTKTTKPNQATTITKQTTKRYFSLRRQKRPRNEHDFPHYILLVLSLSLLLRSWGLLRPPIAPGFAVRVCPRVGLCPGLAREPGEPSGAAPGCDGCGRFRT